MPTEDKQTQVRRTVSTCIPIAVGENMYSIRRSKKYLSMSAVPNAQVDLARIGNKTPWLKVAHFIDLFNVVVCSHLLMELYDSVVYAIPNTRG